MNKIKVIFGNQYSNHRNQTAKIPENNYVVLPEGLLALGYALFILS